MKAEKECVLVIDTIRSAHNTGSMFRTADGAGVSRIILTGYTPAPIEKGKARPDIAKVALGAEISILWEKVDTAVEALSKLKKEGYAILVLEKMEGSQPLFEYESPKKFALFVGNEVDGVPQEVLNLCDAILEIPMRGVKESLNVSVAAGVALYALLS